jgi:hypothetical protein
MAAATADVTSIPAAAEPDEAARMELMLIDGVVVAVPDKSVLTAETELIVSTCFCEGSLSRARAFGCRVVYKGACKSATHNSQIN